MESAADLTLLCLCLPVRLIAAWTSHSVHLLYVVWYSVWTCRIRLQVRISTSLFSVAYSVFKHFYCRCQLRLADDSFCTFFVRGSSVWTSLFCRKYKRARIAYSFCQTWDYCRCALRLLAEASSTVLAPVHLLYAITWYWYAWYSELLFSVESNTHIDTHARILHIYQIPVIRIIAVTHW